MTLDNESWMMFCIPKCNQHEPFSTRSISTNSILKNHDRCTASDLDCRHQDRHGLHRLTHSPHLAVTALEPSGWCAEAGVPGCTPTAYVANMRPNCRVSPRHC